MKREWLPILAATLGVSVFECKKDQGTTQAREVPSPTFKIPSPHDTICSVEVARPPFVVGVGGENEGVCYGPVPNPHPSANCGPMATDTPCSNKKPWTPNLRAVVQSSTFGQTELAPPIKEALAKILSCISGPMTKHARLEADANGRVKTTCAADPTKSGRADVDVACVVQAFDAMTLPGMDSLVIDLTST